MHSCSFQLWIFNWPAFFPAINLKLWIQDIVYFNEHCHLFSCLPDDWTVGLKVWLLSKWALDTSEQLSMTLWRIENGITRVEIPCLSIWYMQSMKVDTSDNHDFWMVTPFCWKSWIIVVHEWDQGNVLRLHGSLTRLVTINLSPSMFPWKDWKACVIILMTFGRKNDGRTDIKGLLLFSLSLMFEYYETRLTKPWFKFTPSGKLT